MFARAVRGHWEVESMHWQLDVTFREDANHTLDKIAAQNQNVIRKWCLSILKLLEIRGKKMSMQRKRFNIAMNPMKYLEEILSFKKRVFMKLDEGEDSCVCRAVTVSQRLNCYEV